MVSVFIWDVLLGVLTSFYYFGRGHWIRLCFWKLPLLFFVLFDTCLWILEKLLCHSGTLRFRLAEEESRNGSLLQTEEECRAIFENLEEKLDRGSSSTVRVEDGCSI